VRKMTIPAFHHMQYLISAVFLTAMGFQSLCAQELPAGSELQIRLQQTVSSFGSRTGDLFQGIVIAPVERDGQVIIPLDTQITGAVTGVRRVGLGFVRESASIRLSLQSLRLPDGTLRPLAGSVSSVDNARETVDATGRIRGIRATASLSSVISGLAVSATVLDPMFLSYGLASSLSVFRIPESEIILPPGTELRFVTTQAAALPLMPQPPVARIVGDQAEALSTLVHDLPFRTTTQGSSIPSDFTNLAFLAEEGQLRSAFEAAGWVETHALNARSTYHTMRSIVENQGYREAPMSVLLLEGQAPRITYAKTLNTFFQRHHLRIFASDARFGGQQVWTASSTHDSGIGFSVRDKTFIHLIDQDIDREREKVVNDLMLTGCVDSVERVERPWLPDDASNATGDALRTDKKIAVVRFSACENPRRANVSILDKDPATRPSMPTRSARDAVLSLRNDLVRGNIGYQGYAGIRMLFSLRSAKKNSGEGALAEFNYGGETWKIVPSEQRLGVMPDAPKAHHRRHLGFHVFDTAPNTYQNFLEFSLSGGYSRFGNERFSTQAISANLPEQQSGPVTIPLLAHTSLRPGASIALNTTFHAHKFLSHELGFTHNGGELNIHLVSADSVVPRVRGNIAIRQFHYALLTHLRPNGKRFRPFVAIGGGYQGIHLTEDAVGQSRLLRFTFREVNAFYRAFRFGSTPPLEGGGIFQPTLQYGGGFRFYLTRHLALRADWRETLSRQPDFWTKSYPSLLSADLENGAQLIPGRLTSHQSLRQQRISIGIGVTF